MTIFLFCFLWWLIGAAMFLHVCWAIIPEIKVKDLFVMLFAGTLGPIGVIFYIHWPARGVSFMNKTVFRKKYD